MKVSVIIPCYNDGQYLSDAIKSVIDHPYFPKRIEVIVVNDGSTEGYTIEILKEIEEKKNDGIIVIHQENKGLGAARNKGISMCNSEVFIPLDADNMLTKEYIDCSLEILDGQNYQDIDILYGKPIFFSEDGTTRSWKTGPFDRIKIIQNNYIDACSVIKKSIWEKVGGYDEEMPVQGYEDWDFWIRASGKNAIFRYIDKGLFYYRIRSDSMISNTVKESNLKLLRNYIYSKNIEIILSELKHLNGVKIQYNNDRKRPLRSFIKYLYHKL